MEIVFASKGGKKRPIQIQMLIDPAVDPQPSRGPLYLLAECTFTRVHAQLVPTVSVNLESKFPKRASEEINTLATSYCSPFQISVRLNSAFIDVNKNV